MNNLFFEKAIALLQKIDQLQVENIEAVSDLFVDSLGKGGIIQTFGNGHSYAAAIEIVERAGGLFSVKAIREPSMGLYETIEGVGTYFMHRVEVLPEDVVVVFSHSGRNPLVVEVASIAKERGAKIVAVTSLEASKQLTSRHSSGKLLYHYADAVLDTLVEAGDASIALEGMDAKVCPVSSVGAVALMQATMLRTYEKMLAKGIVPEVRISGNVEGGRERSLELQRKYASRVNRI